MRILKIEFKFSRWRTHGVYFKKGAHGTWGVSNPAPEVCKNIFRIQHDLGKIYLSY